MSKILAVVINSHQIYKQKNSDYFSLLRKISAPNKENYIIDLCNLMKIKSCKTKLDNITPKKNQHLYVPRSFFDFYKFLKTNKIIALIMIEDKLKNILVNIFLGIFIYKRFAISPLGYLSDNSMPIETNYKKHLNFFFNYKFTYYLYRFLYIFHITKNVDYNFEASENKINSYKNSIFYKFKKFINLCFYKQTYRINSLSYSRYLEDKSSTTNKFITFIDGGGANHKDVIIRDGIISNKNKILFYNNLTLFLKKVSALYNKDVIYCLHPKVNYNQDNTFKIIKNNFSIKLNQTSSYIYKSELVIFFESSAILDAIMLKKKIINLQSNLMGDYLFKRNNLYKKLLDFYQVNIDEIKNYDFKKKTIESIFKNKTNKYNNFIKQNLIFEKNVTYYKQVKKILN